MKQAEKILHLLQKTYPNAKMILEYTNNFELLVAVELSAQCTDKMVNIVTRKLFPKYRKKYHVLGSMYHAYENKTALPEDELVEIINFAFAKREELEQDIRPTGFYKNKAKNLQAAAKYVLEKHQGQLPKTIAEMILIPGAARKTANVVLGNAYQIYEGIAVDTHVKRLSQRLGLTKHTDPNKIEKDLMKAFDPDLIGVDPKDWFSLTYLLIEHGRQICIAQKPKCDICPLNKICPSAFKFPHFMKQ